MGTEEDAAMGLPPVMLGSDATERVKDIQARDTTAAFKALLDALTTVEQCTLAFAYANAEKFAKDDLLNWVEKKIVEIAEIVKAVPHE